MKSRTDQLEAQNGQRIVCALRVREVYDSMATEGKKGQASFNERDILKTRDEMAHGRLNLIKDQKMLYKGARLYHALRAIIQAEGFTSAALKC